MILNSKLWQEVVAAALAAVGGNQQWTRAIERGAKEALKAHWRFDGEVLVIKSTTSGKLYRVNGHCECEAAHNGNKACKHRAAKQLIIRYRERLAAVEPVKQTVTMAEPVATLPPVNACAAQPVVAFCPQCGKAAEQVNWVPGLNICVWCAGCTRNRDGAPLRSTDAEIKADAQRAAREQARREQANSILGSPTPKGPRVGAIDI